MRQALIVTNPKWEPFAAVSGKFKALSGDAVLVVRGRVKEKKTSKIKQLAKKAAAVACVTLGFTLSAYAQADITALLPTTNLNAATTNSTGSGFIGWNLGDIAQFSASVQSTNTVHATTKSNIIIRLDSSLNGTDWVTAAYSLTFPTAATATTANPTILTLTNTGGKYLRVGAVENANTNRVIISRFTWQKD